jgi:cyclopropane fatty-acyl-phospholipid synthase-like methyltransferase
LIHRLINHVINARGYLALVDSPEVLQQIPHYHGSVYKFCGKFPQDFQKELEHIIIQYDSIIVYSVLQHVHLDGNLMKFIRAAEKLLAPGGQMLLGDIPNRSMYERHYHKDDAKRRLSDGYILHIIEGLRYRGFDAFILPQPKTLPYHDRREDILVVKPECL